MPEQARTKIEQTGREHPSLLAMLSFLMRSKGLQARRALMAAFSPRPAMPKGAVSDFPYILAESVTALDSGADLRERPLLLGKIQNLRIACRALHHRVLAAGETFSFWSQIGPPWSSRGFAVGREVREGCVIPTTGGGLCQLSGSLLEVASALDFDVVERHQHTALPSDIPYNPQRDATLFWNYVDLRFRSQIPVMLEAYLSPSELVIRLRGQSARKNGLQSLRTQALISAETASPLAHAHLESCHTCNQTACARHRIPEKSESQKTAFLVDEYQPEYDAYIRENRTGRDQLLFPFADRRSRTWSTQGFESVRSSFWFRVRRSRMLRSAVARGITVAKAHYEIAETLTETYERNLAYDAEHLCVAQTLLPHLWRAGVLGGRSFDVLMARPPVAMIEQRLDEAAAMYPTSKTLTEFRAPQWFAEAEAEALQAARNIVTPHPQIAALFKNAVKLPWQTQTAETRSDDKKRDLIAFFGPTLARKGAYAVREAIRRTGLPLTILGSEIEEADFWKGLPVVRTTQQQLQWDRIHTVLQPSLFEYWPRQLLRARAAGCRVVVSPFCGFEEDAASGMYHVPFGDVDVLVAAIQKLQPHPHAGAGAKEKERSVQCAS